MASSQDPAFWESLLGRLLEPDTVVINDATAKLTELLGSNDTIVFIFERLSNSSNVGVRHQAALLVRRRINSAWDSLPNNICDGMKDTLANIIINQETPRPIRKASADIMASIAKITLPEDKWPSYFPFVVNLITTDNRPDLREVGLYLLQQVLETSLYCEQDLVLSKNFEDITTFIGRGLQDRSADVRIQAMSCMNTYVECLDFESEAEAFLALLRPLIEAVKVSVEDHDERVAIGFEVLNYIAESHIGKIQQVLPDLLVFMLNIGADKETPISIRQKALMFIEFVISTKPKSFVKSNLLEPAIKVSFELMTEEEDDISGEDTGSKYGIQLIDCITMVMPADIIWSTLMNYVREYVRHSNPEYRKAAINCIAILANGCVDEVEEIFDDLMPLVLNGFSQENCVRQASCIAIAEFAKNLPYSIVPYGEQLVPILIGGIHDEQDLVRSKSCYALSMCSSLKQHLMPHIEPLLKRLVEMLKDSNIEIQESAVGALSAIIDMAEESIGPYFNAIIDVMNRWIQVTDPKQFSVKSRAIDCVASLAGAQKELFRPHFDSCTQAVLSGFQFDNSELREYIFTYCEHMARLFTDQLTPYVDGLVPYLIASVECMDALSEFPEDDFNVDAPSDANDMDQKLGQMVQEKDAAISLLGWLAFNYCKEFSKYIPKVKEDLIGMVGFLMSPSTSSAATLALVQLCSCVSTLVDPEQGWIQGVVEPLHNDVAEMINEVLNLLVENLDIDDDIIVRNTLEAIGNLSIAFGPAAIPQEYMIEIVNSMMQILKREAPCQLAREAFEDDDSEFSLFVGTMENVSQFARVYGKSFVPTLEQFLMCLPRYFEPGTSNNYKNCSIATLAEVTQELKEGFTPYCATFLPIAIDLLNNVKDKTMKHNACYCSGLLVQYGGPAVHQYLEVLYNSLCKALTLDPVKYETVLDNACGALARMINAAPDKMPIDQIVPGILNLLPLRNDFEPAIPIHECIFNLLQANHATVSNVQQLLCLFIQEILTASLPTDSLQNQVFAFVKSSYASNAQQVESIMQTLVSQGRVSEENAKQLHTKLNSS